MTERAGDVAGWRLRGLVAMAMASLAAAVPAAGRDLYVAPDGKPGAAGTKESPLDLATATGTKSPAAAGDTIWLAGGTYRAPLTTKVAGKEGAPITIRALPGVRATFDCRLPEGASGLSELWIGGDWTVWWGLEVMCSDPVRRTGTGGSHPGEIRRGGLSCAASHVKFINLIVHDCSNGFGFWSGGEGGEIYGCLIYNNGWIGPDRGHGHAIYTQNQRGTKRLVDNVMFHQFSYGIHAYGSEKAFITGFHVEGNVSFLNGSPAGGRSPAMLIGAGSPAERIAVVGNYTWGDEQGGGNIQLGYGSKHNRDAAVRDNYVVGRVDLLWWEKLAFEGNTVIGRDGPLRLEPPAGRDIKGLSFDRNTYWLGDGAAVATVGGPGGGKLGQEAWKKLGFDAAGQFRKGRPEAASVFIRPNQYEPGRAHIIVYNWPAAAAVEADLSKVLPVGKKYRIVSAQDFFGKPVAEGTSDGKPVPIPMTDCRAAPPIGMPDHKPPATGPAFNVFILLPA